MQYEKLIHNLWPVGLALQGVLTAILIRKRAWISFPFFTIYSIFEFLTAFVLFVMRNHPQAYFYIYWPSEAFGLVLNIAVMYEVFRQLFGPYRALRRMAWRTLQGAVLVLVVMAVALLATSAASERWHIIGSTLFGVQESVRMIQLGIVTVLFLFSGLFRLHWRQAVFGIALGIGIFAAAEVVTSAAWTRVADSKVGLLSVVRMLAFDAGLVIWGAYMLIKEDLTCAALQLPEPGELDRLDKMLAKAIYQ